jgi:hypothetical protein
MDSRREGPGRIPPEELIYSMFYDAFRAGIPQVSVEMEAIFGVLLKLLRDAHFFRGNFSSFPEFGNWWAVDGAYGTVTSVVGECGVSVAVAVGMSGGALIYDFRPAHFYADLVDAQEIGVRMLLSEMELAVRKLQEGVSGVVLDGSAYGFIRRIQAAPEKVKSRAWELFGRLFEASLQGRALWVPKDVRSKPLIRFIREDLLPTVDRDKLLKLLKEALPQVKNNHLKLFSNILKSLSRYRETYLAGLIISHRCIGHKGCGEMGYGMIGPVDMLKGADNEIAKQMRDLLPDGAGYAAFYVWLPRWKGWRYAVRVEAVMPRDMINRPLPPRSAGGSVVGDALKLVIATMDDVPRSGLVLAADESAKAIVGRALELIKRSGLLLGSPRGDRTPSSTAGGV